jgi:arginase family enzyme
MKFVRPYIVFHALFMLPFIGDVNSTLLWLAEQAASYGSQDVLDTNMHVFDLSRVKDLKITAAAPLAVKQLLKNELDGFWVHLDADVLDDSIMPAVDYRLDNAD